MITHWSNAHIGLPYAEFGRDRAGVDCWGLFRLIYQHDLGIELPTYLGDYTSVEEHAELQALIRDVTMSGPWIRVEDMPRAYDAAVFRRGHNQTHIGAIVRPGRMLHIAGAGRTSCIEDYRKAPWQHRLTGVYRHVELASKVPA